METKRVVPPTTTLVMLERAEFPVDLAHCANVDAVPRISALGDLGILQTRTLALFCSVRCPGRLILQTYDLALALREAGTTVVGGFHTPMEKECLALLLRGTQPVVICPARSIEGMRLPAENRKPLADGRLLVLSPFAAKQRRVTTQTAEVRNRFVAALADGVFVAHAAPGGKTERLCRDVLGWGKTLLTLDSPENAELIEMGAVPVSPETVAQEGVVGVRLNALSGGGGSSPARTMIPTHGEA